MAVVVRYGEVVARFWGAVVEGGGGGVRYRGVEGCLGRLLLTHNTRAVPHATCTVGMHGHVLLRMRRGVWLRPTETRVVPNRQFEARCLRHFCTDFVVLICWHVHNVLVRRAITANTSRPPPPPHTHTPPHWSDPVALSIREPVCGQARGFVKRLRAALFDDPTPVWQAVLWERGISLFVPRSFKWLGWSELLGVGD